ncbi:MAG: DNA methyltransferase [Thermoplasmatota archaeon]
MTARGRVYNADSRRMPELSDGSVQLVVTSPPYWRIKDYGHSGQIGYGQSLHDYLRDLRSVWEECHRVIRPGRRLCINIGDQFARSTVYGRYKVIPLHAEFISQCQDIGFDFMGSVIWQKRTTVNTSGGATVMGSYPYPPNGILELDYEYILIFKKPGREKFDPLLKKESKLTKDQWKRYFSGHWNIKGERQKDHEAMFPMELPVRLIRMFSFVGDTVLDPFLGSGTTVKAALDLGRTGIGYEINDEFIPFILEKVGEGDLEIIRRESDMKIPLDGEYEPSIPDAEPLFPERDSNDVLTVGVRDIDGSCRLILEDGSTVALLGIEIIDPEGSADYLRERVKGKQVIIREDRSLDLSGGAYVYLKNRIFVNSYMIRSGLARARNDLEYEMRERFLGYRKVNRTPRR